MPSYGELLKLLTLLTYLCLLMVEIREAELVDDSELFIGPPPPAFVSEVESSNEAERFEEVPFCIYFTPYTFFYIFHSIYIFICHH